jgi:hypothetical protein
MLAQAEARSRLAPADWPEVPVGKVIPVWAAGLQTPGAPQPGQPAHGARRER